ncbi:MAG: hypothetical protein Q9216_005813 [Gyalolechia sp. 2 TL-2023]
MRRPFVTTVAFRQVQDGGLPMLAKFRTDMKEAMKAKDAQRYCLTQKYVLWIADCDCNIRLNTLRGILTETTSLEKQSQGIESKSELYKLLRKRQKACATAAKEFQDAGRVDLVGKENEQIGILQGYLNEFDVLSKDQTVTAIQDLVKWMESKGSKPRRGTVRKQLFQENGAFYDKIVDEHLVTMTINDLVEEMPPRNRKSKQRLEMDRLKAQAEESNNDIHPVQ